MKKVVNGDDLQHVGRLWQLSNNGNLRIKQFPVWSRTRHDLIELLGYLDEGDFMISLGESWRYSSSISLSWLVITKIGVGWIDEDYFEGPMI